MPLLALSSLSLLAGCGEPPEITFDYVLSRDAFELGEVTWADPPTSSATVSLLNLSSDELRVTVIEVIGEGAGMVEPAATTDFSTVQSEASVGLQVSLVSDQLLWDDGVFEPALVVQLGRLIDPSSDWDNPDEWRHTEIEIPIRLSIGCDLDVDGVEAAACGGGDCADEDPAISTSATEVCDGIDNDCDGTVDLTATDAEKWFFDADADGFGDPATAVDACDTPAGHVIDGSDCDDGDPFAYPGAPETSDGDDDDCDEWVDEDATPVGGLVVTEIHVDASLGAAGLQWFEVTNASAVTLTLDGWEVVATDAGTATSFFVSPDAALALLAGEIALFCQDADALAAAAPAVVCDYEYATADNGLGDSLWGPDQAEALVLDDNAGALRLAVAGTTIDTVVWDLAEAWPLTAGASLALDPASTDAVSNDLPARWCAGSVAYSEDGLSLGSPGSANDLCPM